jgi:hypothetical protein
MVILTNMFRYLYQLLLRRRFTGLLSKKKSWIFSRRKNITLGDLSSLSAKGKKVNPAGGSITWRVYPRGFDPFDPTEHPALPALQTRAVHDLFAYYHLPWIPAEYWAILQKSYPDPVDALIEFCQVFGLAVEALRHREPAEVALLHQCVGILFELGRLEPELSAANRLQILACLRPRHYEAAEELLTRARLVIEVLREAAGLRTKIVFPVYQAFIQELERCQSDVFQLSQEEAEDARHLNEQYKTLQNEFDALIRYCNDLIDWLHANWPDDVWGDANEALAQGMVAAKDELEKHLRHDAAMDPFEGVAHLDSIQRDLAAFVEEVKMYSGGAAGREAYAGTLAARMAEWHWALALFAFADTDIPSQEEITKRYRQAALTHHPDRWPPSRYSAEVIAEHQRAFQDAHKARGILEKGQPEPISEER